MAGQRIEGSHPLEQHFDMWYGGFAPGDFVHMGAERIGVVLIDPRRIVYTTPRRVHSLSVSRVPSEHVVLRARTTRLRKKLAAYFDLQQRSSRLIDAGIRAAGSGNVRFFENPDVMPDPVAYSTEMLRTRAWARLLASMRCGDSLLCCDVASAQSRAIARLDKGSWSHVAVCLSGGRILDTTLAGIEIVSVERYNRPTLHVGLYRLYLPPTEVQQDAIEGFARSMDGRPYDALGAVKAGINALMDSRALTFTLADGSELPHITPNGIVYSGRKNLICHV